MVTMRIVGDKIDAFLYNATHEFLPSRPGSHGGFVYLCIIHQTCMFVCQSDELSIWVCL